MLINDMGSEREAHHEIRCVCICAGALMWRAAPTAQEEARPFPKPRSAGTATPGGGFPLYGNAFAEIFNAADPTLAVEPRNTKG